MRDDDRTMTVSELRVMTMHTVRRGLSAEAADLGVSSDDLFRTIALSLIGLRPLDVDDVGAICPGCHHALKSRDITKRDNDLREFVRQVGEDAACSAFNVDRDELKRQMGE